MSAVDRAEPIKRFPITAAAVSLDPAAATQATGIVTRGRRR